MSPASRHKLGPLTVEFCKAERAFRSVPEVRLRLGKLFEVELDKLGGCWFTGQVKVLGRRLLFGSAGLDF